MVFLAALIGACGGLAEDADSLEPAASPSSNDSGASETETDEATLGWVISGPDGSEFDFKETLTANNADTINTYTYAIEGQLRQGLYTQFVKAATIEVSPTSGGPLTVQLVRGTRAADGFSVDIVEVIESREVSAGDSVSLSAEL